MADAPRVEGLFSILLDTRNRENSLGFYRDVLGLPLIEAASGDTVSVLSLGGGSILVLHAATDEEFHGTGVDPGGHAVTFRVDDPSAWAERLTAAGIEHEGPLEQVWGWAVFTSDPDGRSVALAKPKF